ncbi:MAG: DNA primase [Robiginitomaculum sp.]|nr:MAG: DNA primase [Robiginitomaculum sp.]
MRFGEDFIEELKSRVKPSDVIGRTVKLRRQGREFAGLSPFNKEKTPSFFVNDEKGFYHCFSSGRHGDVISWFQETEGLSFTEAVERLADEAGMALPAPDPGAAQKAQRQKGLVEWMEEAARFYAAELGRVRGRHARHYLENRGLDESAWGQFGMGYAPASHSALKDYLLQKGANLGALVEAGLLIAPDDGKAPYDRFRDRVMFPIHDARRRLVGFGGRALSAEAKAKYLNSPETPLFHKGSTLYYYAHARTAVRKASANGLIVVEGYMDVIALTRAGIDHAVAPLGTALTEDQLRLLWQAGPEPILCFDGDKAGQQAAHRALDRALPLLEPGRTLRFSFLPAGLDPDDMLRQRGRAAMDDVLRDARPLVDVLWEREREREPLDTPEARAGFKKRLREIAGEIGNKEVASFYTSDFFARLDVLFRRPSRVPSGRAPAKAFPSQGLRNIAKRQVSGLAEQRFLIAQVIAHPQILTKADETFANMLLSEDALIRLQAAILEHWLASTSVDRESLHRHLTHEGFADDLKQLERRTIPVPEQSETDRVTRWMQTAQDLIGRMGLADEQAARRQQLLDGLKRGDQSSLRALGAARESVKPGDEDDGAV